MAETYDAIDIVNKTLYAKSTVPVYRDPTDRTPFGTVAPGNIVGVVFSWYGPNLSYGVPDMWWEFKDANRVSYYAVQQQGLYDEDMLKKQGVKSTQQKERERQNENLEWYQKVLNQVLPVAVIAILGVATIKALVSRSSQSKL